jgi:hypothetical protein
MAKQIKNLTYHNLMVVIKKIQDKGWSFSEAEQSARRIFAEYEAHPMGLSIQARINQILTKEEWEAEMARF